MEGADWGFEAVGSPAVVDSAAALVGTNAVVGALVATDIAVGPALAARQTTSSTTAQATSTTQPPLTATTARHTAGAVRASTLTTTQITPAAAQLPSCPHLFCIPAFYVSHATALGLSFSVDPAALHFEHRVHSTHSVHAKVSTHMIP